MKLNEIYSSSGGFLKADDIGSSKPTVTIESTSVATKDYGDGSGPKSQIVLAFVGKDKKLGLNFTNANKIAELTGKDNIEDWVGVTIKLHVEKVKVGTEMKPSIRIWPELPEQVPFEASAQFTGANSPPNVNATPPDDDPDAAMNW